MKEESVRMTRAWHQGQSDYDLERPLESPYKDAELSAAWKRGLAFALNEELAYRRGEETLKTKRASEFLADA